MELLYLFIYDFRKIKQQAFNFSAELRFDLGAKKTKKGNNYQLHIASNPDYVNLFESRILNVTGVIGKNGSGKSTLLNCLKLMGSSLHQLTSPLIFCVRDKGNRTIYTCYYGGGDEQGMSSLNVEVSYGPELLQAYNRLSVHPYTVDRMSIDKELVKGLPFELEQINFCFFSNVFDSQFEVIYDGILNISTNQKIEDFLKTYIVEEIRKAKLPEQKERGFVLFPSHINEYHSQQLKLYLDFLAYAKTRSQHKLPDLPQRLTFNFEFTDYIFMISDARSQMSYPIDDLKKIHKKAFDIIQQTTSYIASFHNLVLLCTFYYALRWNRLDKENRVNIYETLRLMANEEYDLFNEIRRILSSIPYRDHDEKKKNLLDNILSVNFREELARLHFISRDYAKNNKVNYQFEIDNKLWPVLSVIHDLTALDNTFFMTYSWDGALSTGQEAFIAQFSRLFGIRPKVGNRPIWLMIDEGDLHFHPEMQKEYFSKLLQLLTFIFPRNDIQLFISTHSPFIVSDLPKQNLIFMKNENGLCLVDLDNIRQDTFGANIHELFKDALFLTGSLMGDFAKSKIDAVINWCLSDKKVNQEDAERMRKTVLLIGEPIIRSKLAEMIAEKTGQNQELAKLEEQERYIQKRIRQIKSGNDQDQV